MSIRVYMSAFVSIGVVGVGVYVWACVWVVLVLVLCYVPMHVVLAEFMFLHLF